MNASNGIIKFNKLEKHTHMRDRKRFPVRTKTGDQRRGQIPHDNHAVDDCHCIKISIIIIAVKR